MDNFTNKGAKAYDKYKKNINVKRKLFGSHL